jgi:hypothetical protein
VVVLEPAARALHRVERRRVGGVDGVGPQAVPDEDDRPPLLLDRRRSRVAGRVGGHVAGDVRGHVAGDVQRRVATYRHVDAAIGRAVRRLVDTRVHRAAARAASLRAAALPAARATRLPTARATALPTARATALPATARPATRRCVGLLRVGAGIDELGGAAATTGCGVDRGFVVARAGAQAERQRDHGDEETRGQ